MVNWKQVAEFVGAHFIEEMDEPERWDVCVRSNGMCKCLDVYDKVSCDTKLTLVAPTYRDLYNAAQFAWNIHTMAKRGF